MLRKIMMGQASLYDSSLTAMIERALFLGYTIPNESKLSVLNSFIVSLKLAGIWNKLDELKVYKYNDASLQNFSTLNLINPLLYQSTVIGINCVYGVNGWIGGAGSAINTNFIPTTPAIKFTLNSAAQGCYVYNDALNNNQVIGSVGSVGVTSRTYMFVRFTATSFNININSSGTLSVGSNATSIGLHSSNRVNNATSNYYIDGVLKVSAGTGVGSLSDRAIYVCGFNNNGATVANNSQGVSMNYHGSDLTNEMAAFNTIWNTYLSNI